MAAKNQSHQKIQKPLEVSIPVMHVIHADQTKDTENLDPKEIVLKTMNLLSKYRYRRYLPFSVSSTTRYIGISVYQTFTENRLSYTIPGDYYNLSEPCPAKSGPDEQPTIFYK